MNTKNNTQSLAKKQLMESIRLALKKYTQDNLTERIKKGLALKKLNKK